jgi:3-hydroxyacyl-CoA dehydrogenase
VREDIAVKRELFALADELTPEDALIATSSSGLSISEIQTAAARPRRTLAAHPYNPPHLVPLVELAPGSLTAPETMQRARSFYGSVGKEPVVLSRDIPGYIVNRISAALWREAVELVRAGVVSVADLDRAVCTGPGLRWAAMGPHLIYDLGGGREGIRGHVDHLAAVKEGMLRDLATWVTFPADTAEVLAEGLPQEKGELLAAARSTGSLPAEMQGQPGSQDDYEELCRLRDELLAAYVGDRRRILGGGQP